MELRIGTSSVVMLLQSLDEIGLREQQIRGGLEAHHGRALFVRRHIASHTALRPSANVRIHGAEAFACEGHLLLALMSEPGFGELLGDYARIELQVVDDEARA